MRGAGFAVVRIALLAATAFLCVASALNRAANSDVSPSPLLTAIDFGEITPRKQALAALQHGDSRLAEALAVRSVDKAPVQQQNLAILGAARLGENSADAARSAFLVAGQLGWRDRTTQLYWIDYALTVSDLDQAAMRADALLRAGDTTAPIAGLFFEMEQAPEGRAAISKRLAGNPPWADAYLYGLYALPSTDAVANRISVLQRAAAMGFKTNCAAAARTAQALIRQGNFAAASALWFQLCRPNTKSSNDVFDIGFDGADSMPIASPFDWQLLNNGAVDVRIVEAPAPGRGKALYIESASSVRESPARHFLTLPAGRYQLSWTISGEANPGALLVTVTCANSHTDLGQPGATAIGKGRFVSEFTVPGQSCGGQLVSLSIEPKADRDTVSLYLIGMQVRRLAGPEN